MAKPFLLIELKSGTVKIEMLPELAPKHVAQITTLAEQGAYDGIAFHRVMDGFMAQTGDVKYGKVQEDGSVSGRAGTGDSDLPDIPAEFTKTPFDRGMVGMARTDNPNSANSQFFIMFEDGHFLNEKYTVWGRVVDGMQHVDNIKLGAEGSGKVTKPDQMIKVTVSDE
ncbi:MAG: peptidylprolyl isomerase [Pseudomonadota bacterium]